MSEPTVGDVYDKTVPRIIALREAFFRDEAARWLFDPPLDPETGEHINYPCFRCGRFHFRWSAVGQRHESRADPPGGAS